MSTPKAHEQHQAHAEKVAQEQHDPSKAPAHDGGGDAAGEAAPKGTPTSDRHETETAKPEA
jgi:hypothetical protein